MSINYRNPASPSDRPDVIGGPPVDQPAESGRDLNPGINDSLDQRQGSICDWSCPKCRQPEFYHRGQYNIQKLIHNLFGFHVIIKDILFYAGFAIMIALQRQNKIVGIGQ